MPRRHVLISGAACGLAAFQLTSLGAARSDIRPVGTLPVPVGAALTGAPAGVSGSTLVAGSSTVNVYTRPAGGWIHAAPPAVLSDASLAGFDAGARAASVSGNTIAASFQSFSAAGASSEDIFVRPAAGWSNTGTPTARLATEKPGEQVSGGVVVDRTVVAFVSKPSMTDNQQAAGATVAIYRRPAGGWSGTVFPVAQLALPRASVALTQLAFTGSAVFVPTSSGEALVYREPAAGWAGTIRPSATLEAAGNVSISGNSVLVGHRLFVRPRQGWVGRLQSTAVLTPTLRATANNGYPEQAQALTSTNAVYAEVNVQSGEGCTVLGCPTTIYNATRPGRGWRGRLTAKPLLRMLTYDGIELVAAEGDLFLWTKGQISIYELDH